MKEDYRDVLAREDRITELENELDGSNSAFSGGLEGSTISEEMLAAAMNKAVEMGIVAKWADEETYLKNWDGMKEVLKAALAA